MAKKKKALFDITDTWLKRDGDSYVILRDEFPSDKQLEDFITKKMFFNTSLKSILADLIAVARSVLRSISVTRRKIILHKDGSKTDHFTIWIATDMFDRTTEPLVHQMAVFLGLTIHEGSHCLHTDNELVQNTIAGNLFYHDLWNRMEDERIEALTCVKYPGYAPFLAKTKYHYFEILSTERGDQIGSYRFSSTPFDIIAFPDAEEVIGATKYYFESREKRINYEVALYHSIIRYPKFLLESDVEYFFTVMKDVKEAMTPYPSTNEGCLASSRLVYEYFLKLLPPGKGIEEVVLVNFNHEEETTKQLEIADLLSIEGTVVPYEGNLLRMEGNDKDAYMTAYRDIKRFIPSLKRFFTYTDEVRTHEQLNLKSGTLDQRKIVEAAHGIESVYYQVKDEAIPKWDVAVLADLSGSMYGDKIEICKRTCILLNEAFKDRTDTDLYIYGHTADHEQDYITTLSVFKEPGFHAPYALGSIESKSCNRDGYAILLTAKRVRTYSKNPCIMLVISDGLPNGLRYDGKAAIEHTKKSVHEVEQDNFYVIQIALDSPGSDLMFKHFVKFQDYSNLPLDLNILLKRLTRRLA